MPGVPMKLKFSVTAKSGPQTIAYVQGVREIPADEITVEELQEIPRIEAALEKLTGLRFHINQVA